MADHAGGEPSRPCRFRGSRRDQGERSIEYALLPSGRAGSCATRRLQLGAATHRVRGWVTRRVARQAFAGWGLPICGLDQCDASQPEVYSRATGFMRRRRGQMGPTKNSASSQPPVSRTVSRWAGRKRRSGRKPFGVRSGTGTGVVAASAPGGCTLPATAPMDVVFDGDLVIGLYRGPNDAQPSDFAVAQPGGTLVRVAAVELVFWGRAWEKVVNPSRQDIVDQFTLLVTRTITWLSYSSTAWCRMVFISVGSQRTILTHL